VRKLRSHRIASAIACCVAWALADSAEATIRYGDVQISGNLSSQNLFRIQGGADTFSAFNPVQQRNTFRLQYEHRIMEQGRLLGGETSVPFVDQVDLFAYYRFVYDSIYDIAPDALLRTHSGSPGGRISDFAGRDRADIAFENELREIFVDVKTGPLTFRIGRQQIVWGEALLFRALDSVNGLDASWHLIEAGLLGKVGFDELRIPAWAVKVLVDLGEVGPFSNAFLEAYDIPFDFHPSYARFLPAPWSGPLRNPLRGGLILDAGELVQLPTGVVFVQPCFDLTGNPESIPTAGANGHAVDFSDTPRTGICNSTNLPTSSIRQGIYDRRDPRDVNQVGARFGASLFGVGFTVNYMYRRHIGLDIPSAGLLKVPWEHITGDLTSKIGFIHVDPHETTDPILRRTSLVVGYLRLPAEFYYPYVHVAGLSANAFEPMTGAVVTLEATVTHGLPIFQADLVRGNLVKKKDVVLAALGVDRPTWIRWLNRRATWLVLGQMGLNWIPDHEKVRRAGNLPGTLIPNYTGDVGIPPPLTRIAPGLLDDDDRIDRLKPVEMFTFVGATSFYRGGSIAPQVAWLSNWTNAPSMAFLLSVDYLPRNDIILTAGLSIFTNFGKIVDDAFAFGRLSQWDEVKLKATYQF
jgi:hypothetical protein